MPVKFVDLFCGMGSFHYSFKKRNWECVMACDISAPAKATYKKNFGIEPKDDICAIKTEELPAYDVLCAGFPCQPFSQIGQHRGVNDARGTMFWQVMRFVKGNVPKAIILENVPALLTHDNGSTFAAICKELVGAGYEIRHKILKCSDFGIPQMRRRLFIVAIKNSAVKKDMNLDKLFDLQEYKQQETLTSYLGKNFERTTAYTIRCGGRHSAIDDRHNWDGYIVDGREYRLTIEDALKLQGFSDYELVGNETEKWKLLGNTIPTNFTDILAQQLPKFCIF